MSSPPARRLGSPGLSSSYGWTRTRRLFLSAVTVAEIEDGIAKLRREGATRKSEDLKDWFETVLHLYGDRVLRVRYARRHGSPAPCRTGRADRAKHREWPTSSSRRRHNTTD